MYRNHNIIRLRLVDHMYKLNIIIIIISRSRHVNVHWSDYILLVKLVFFCWVLLQHAADDIAERDYFLVC